MLLVRRHQVANNVPPTVASNSFSTISTFALSLLLSLSSNVHSASALRFRFWFSASLASSFWCSDLSLASYVSVLPSQDNVPVHQDPQQEKYIPFLWAPREAVPTYEGQLELDVMQEVLEWDCEMSDLENAQKIGRADEENFEGVDSLAVLLLK